MSSVSITQQKLFGMVHKCQKTGDCSSPKVDKIAKSINKSDAEDFAKTKHKGLPKHKSFKEFIEMKSFNQWQEEITQATDSVWSNAKQIGPHTNLQGNVASANRRFDNSVGDDLNKMPLNKKMRYLIDAIQSMTGNEQDVMQDRMLLSKLRAALTRLDNILKSSQQQ